MTTRYIKILDFGVAKLMPQSSGVDPEMATMTKATRAVTLLGTVQYMSPEQASGRPVDYRSDQFSFALILYEMMTVRLAFQKGVSNVVNSSPLPPWLRPKADHALRPVYLDRLAVA